MNTPTKIDKRGILASHQMTVLILGCAIQKLGGKLRITQSDLDEVAFKQLLEYADKLGEVELEIKQPGAST